MTIARVPEDSPSLDTVGFLESSTTLASTNIAPFNWFTWMFVSRTTNIEFAIKQGDFTYNTVYREVLLLAPHKAAKVKLISNRRKIVAGRERGHWPSEYGLSGASLTTPIPVEMSRLG